MSRPLPPASGFPGLPGRSSLRRVLRVRCPSFGIGDLSAYPSQAASEVPALLAQHFLPTVGALPLPLRPANRPEKRILADEWSSRFLILYVEFQDSGSGRYTLLDTLLTTPLVTCLSDLCRRVRGHHPNALTTTAGWVMDYLDTQVCQ